MDVEAALQFVRSNHRAVLATMRRNGTPQLSPVLAVVDGEGKAVISSRETAMKTRNVRRDPRAWLCVFTERFFGGWVQLHGSVEVVSLPAAMDLLVDYYRRAAGEHEDWAEYRAAMQRERRCLLRITVTQAGPDLAG